MKDLLLRIWENRALTLSLKLLSHLTSLLSVAAFGYLCYLALAVSPAVLIKVCVTLALPFLAVTLIRRKINAPRPYELYGFTEQAPRSRKGASFPSRHAHSAFAIGTLLCLFHPALGAVLLALALGMCAARVLLGIHFVRDVAAGALTGVISSLIGALLFGILPL